MAELPRQLDIPGTFPPVDESAWRDLVDKDLRGAPFEKRLVTHTYEGIRLQPLYTPSVSPSAASPYPGFGPFTRGTHTLGASQCGWDVRQERREPVLEDLNSAILDDLLHGVTSVLLRLDLAGRAGLDPTDPRAGRLVGEDGAAVSTLSDLRRAFQGVHLSMIGVALEAGAAFMPASGLLSALWRDHGIADKAARGAFNADPLAVLARDGRLPMPLEDAMAQMADLAARTDATYRNVTAVRVGSAPYHHAGATAAQDLAFLIATGIDYLRTLTTRGLSVDAASRQMLFSVAVGCNFFLAASKLRAARRLWARVIEASGGSDDAGKMRLHVRTSKRVLTHRDPWVNLLRNTACLFSAAVGGAESVTSASFDEALGLPSGRGRRIARNTATILQEESHLLRVVDPAGGSWFVEKLTDELAEKAWVIVQAIEARGGMAKALQDGWVAEQISRATEARTSKLATRRDAVVGVSEFPNVGEAAVETPAVGHAEVVGAARRRLLERGSDAEARAAALEAVRAPGAGECARSVLRAAGAGASLGELAGCLFKGEPESISAPIAPHPYAEAFEHLRDASDAYVGQFGFRPAVYLVCLGTPAESNARSGFAKGFFEAGGFEVISGANSETAAQAASGFAASGASVAVICSTDDRYAAQVETVAPALHAAGARSVVLAGSPGEHEGVYRAAGVDRFIFIRCNVVETLSEMLAEEGVLV